MAQKEKQKLKAKVEEEEGPIKQVSAEELFKEFREVNVSQFFAKNKQYLGYVGKVKSLTTVIHELVTNSLDACEEAGILPDLKVKVEQIGEKDAGKKVKLCGWVQTVRAHGGVVFLDVRDRYGVIQVVLIKKNKSFEAAKTISLESCVYVQGEVVKRKEGTENKDLPNGNIEIFCEDF